MAETPKKKVAPVDIGDSELEARIAQDLEQAKNRNRKLRAFGARVYKMGRGAGLPGKALGGLGAGDMMAQVGKDVNAVGSDIDQELDDESFQAQLLQQQQQQAALEKQKGNSLSESLKNRIASKKGGQAKGMKAKMQKATAKMLTFAWEIIIESFGMAIVVIDIVVFLNLIFGDSVCKLGHEWVPEQIKKLSPKKAEAMGEKMAIVEKIGCACINGCCGLVAMVVIVIVALIVQVVTNPLETFFSMFTGKFWQ
jgi:hypothetical protein